MKPCYPDWPDRASFTGIGEGVTYTLPCTIFPVALNKTALVATSLLAVSGCTSNPIRITTRCHGRGRAILFTRKNRGG